MGGTGDPPVPSGHWPDGTGRTLVLQTDVRKSSCALPVPSGGSPLGTGQWPVPPTENTTPTSEFGFNLKIPDKARGKCWLSGSMKKKQPVKFLRKIRGVGVRKF